MTIQLVFVASPLGTQHNGVRTLEDSIIRCQDGVTYLHDHYVMFFILA
jgi:hypothetical protein